MFSIILKLLWHSTVFSVWDLSMRLLGDLGWGVPSMQITLSSISLCYLILGSQWMFWASVWRQGLVGELILDYEFHPVLGSTPFEGAGMQLWASSESGLTPSVQVAAMARSTFANFWHLWSSLGKQFWPLLPICWSPFNYIIVMCNVLCVRLPFFQKYVVNVMGRGCRFNLVRATLIFHLL